MAKESLELTRVCVERKQEFEENPCSETAGRFVQALYHRRQPELNMAAVFSLIFMAALLLAVAVVYFVGDLDPFYGALAAIIGIGVAAHYAGKRAGAADAFEETRNEFR